MTRKVYTLFIIGLVLLGTRLQSQAMGRDAVTERNYALWRSMPSQPLLSKASHHLYEGQIDSALVCYTILTNRYKKNLSDTTELDAVTYAHVMLGVMYCDHLFDYQKSYQHIYQAEELTKRHHQTAQLSQLYLAKANLLYDLNYVESNYAYQPGLIDAYRKAFYQASKMGDHYIESIALTNMVYLAMKHPDKDDIAKEAQTFLADVQQYESHRIELGKSPHAPDSIVMKDYMMALAQGYLAFHNQEHTKAIQLFKAMPTLIYNQNDNATTRYTLVAGLCEYLTLQTMGRDLDALQRIKEVEHLAQSHHLTHIQLEACRMRYDWLMEHHHDAEARTCLLEYLQTKDLFMQDSKLAKAESGKFLYELQNISDDMREQEHRRQSLQLVLWCVIAFAVVVLALLALLLAKYREVQHKNRALYDRMTQLLEADAAQRRLLEQQATTTVEDKTKYRNNQMDDEAKSQLMHRIFVVMETCSEVYAGDFTLSRLAELAESNTNNVSQVINDRYHVNFKVFLAEYRIKEACRRMQNQENYGNITIEGIATSVGIMSRSNFSALFKRVTGLTPGAYLKQARTGSLPEHLRHP